MHYDTLLSLEVSIARKNVSSDHLAASLPKEAGNESRQRLPGLHNTSIHFMELEYHHGRQALFYLLDESNLTVLRSEKDLMAIGGKQGLLN